MFLISSRDGRKLVGKLDMVRDGMDVFVNCRKGLDSLAVVSRCISSHRIGMVDNRIHDVFI